MKMMMYNCENACIELSENIAVLEILPKQIFRNVILDFKEQTFPAREVAVVENNIALNESQLQCLSDFVNPDMFGRQMLTKLYKHLEKELNYKFTDFSILSKAVKEMKNGLLKMLADIDIDFEASEEIDLKDMFSFVGLKPMTGENSLLDMLIQFVNVCAELKLCKAILAVQLKAYLSDDELVALYRHFLYKGIGLVLLENNHSEKVLQYEQKVFIDNDYSDIIIK